MSSDEEPEFRTFVDARKEAKESSNILNRRITKKPKSKAKPRKKNLVRNEEEPAIKAINPGLLDIINEEISTAKIKEAAEEIVKNENQLQKARSKGEIKKVVIEKVPTVQTKTVHNFEVVLVTNNYKPKGNPESAEKCREYTNRIFNRNNIQRLPLAQILKK